MSPIGRIFIVLNLILSAAFLGWAANALATSQDFKTQLTDAEAAHQETVAAKDRELSDLRVEADQLTNAERERRNERDDLQTEVERLQGLLADEKRRGDQLEGDLTQIRTTLGDYNQTNQQLLADKDRAVERAHEMERERDAANDERDSAVLAMRDAQESKGTADLQIADLEKQVTGLTDEVSKLSTRLEVLVDVTGTTWDDILTQPKIEASVLAVRMDLPPGLVMLNKGSADNVKRGFTFDIYSGNTYKGRVRVQNVQDKVSSALIIGEPTTDITVGDRATTRI